MLPFILVLSLALHASSKPFAVPLPVVPLLVQPKSVTAPENHSDFYSDASKFGSPGISAQPGGQRGVYHDLDRTDHARHWGAFVPYGEENGQTLVRRGVFKRAPAYRGTMMMNCKRAREACQNACWYQNCVRGAQGSTTAVTYTYGGNDDPSPEYAQNRVESGVAVTEGTPCSNWPFGQLFWDPYPFDSQDSPDGPTAPLRSSQRVLQTDEWPMANWLNPDFDPTADPPQHSLRCITQLDNGRGGGEWKYFKNGIAQYNGARLGKHRDKRLGTNAFEAGDTFNVEFDLSEFDDTNPQDVAMKASLSYCAAPFAGCINDGREFHMSKIARTGGGSGVGAYLDFPYDPETMNAYKIDTEANEIKSYQVLIDITGVDGDQYEVTIQTLVNGDPKTVVDTLGVGASITLPQGQSLTLRGGTLPKPLQITRVDDSGCNTILEFTYGTVAAGTYDWYVFRSDRDGYRGKYCETKDLLDDDGDYRGTQFDCYFPGY